MKIYYRFVPIICCIFLLIEPAKAQDEVLQNYVQHGLDSNLIIQQKNLSLQKALNGLQVAKSLYLPSVNVDITYTEAQGGRSINLPVGDMLNPVYNTLNALTQSSNFPAIENQQINFLPQNYYDAKIRTSMPLLNTDLGHNKNIKKNQIILHENEVEIYKRELVKQIKESYFNYNMALQVVAIYKSSWELANESLRVNQKLIDAGKGLPAYLIRAQTEIAQAEAQIVTAEQQVKNTKIYFNSLLNRNMNAEILISDSTQVTQELEKIDLLSLTYQKREELKSLQTNIEIQESLYKMNKQFLVPKLNAFLDLGSQAEGLKFNNDSRYFMIGAQLQMPIFNGNRNRLKIQESKIDIADAKNKLAQAEQQLNMVVEVAKNEVVAANKNYQQAQVQLESAGTYQRLIQKGFLAGVNTYIETIDARTQYTSAKLALNIQKYKLLTSLAKLERESATYLFP
ncbi:TolC family protein [Sphingobacterium sp. SRCM116780]|uniref:TolC family protein n=1 Tax=Sphingobacterium sp. SRCM116780 TaxID=2907623 RepID=UPI001F258898|nr:TolC family protein [Sphingobacterium sp. SRCM116780]UIR57644.1 TolC family protein [Sphingobacterium sp. SRCM116780]